LSRLERVLVTGGAGFIGSHLVDALIESGRRVRILDSLEAQVHGPGQQRPDYLHRDAELIVADVRDHDSVRQALQGMDAVVHLAAAVGVGQSMYEIERYTAVNTLGGAVLLDLLANEPHQVRKLLVASSMSIYGEGAYECPVHGIAYPQLRPLGQLEARDWEIKCPACGTDMRPVATHEEKPLYPTSIYAITKRDHEEMFLSTGFAYGIPAVALRFFNVYGPRQALSNPYTGVMAIFSARVLNGQPPVIYEDGRQTRDFIHISDIVRGCMLALERDEANGQVFNLGTGQATSVGRVAQLLIDRSGIESLELQIQQRFRAGDIRHCFADITRARAQLGFEPQITLEQGLDELYGWLRHQEPEDRFARAEQELAAKALVR
jgi:dTDP-L-rhamnose 4-epimerase